MWLGGVCSEPSADWTTVVIKTTGGDVANVARSPFLFLGRLLSHLCNEDALAELRVSNQTMSCVFIYPFNYYFFFWGVRISVQK